MLIKLLEDLVQELLNISTCGSVRVKDCRFAVELTSRVDVTRRRRTRPEAYSRHSETRLTRPRITRKLA